MVFLSSSLSTTLRHITRTTRRPLSLHPTTSSIRWASIVPYTVQQSPSTSFFSPPPAPMTLEQALEAHQHKQMASLLEEQIKLEQSQRMRFQSELQVELARHRNAILEKQELAALKRKGQLEFEREQERRRRDEEEEEEIRRQQSLQLKTTTTNSTGAVSIEESTVSREASVQDRKTDNNKKSRNSTRTTQAPYTTVAASIIDPRYRTMFGYRGPEHPKSTPAELAELEHERRDNLAASIPTTTTTASSSSLSSPSAKVMAATRITAENRVRLAMMDYTPSQIEALTPEQASTILLLPHFASQAQEQSSSLTHTDTDMTEDTHANTCAQIGDTRTTAAATASTLVEDCNEEEEEEEEEDENRRRLRFTPDVMSSVSLHN